jgi:hypothetical protein
VRIFEFDTGQGLIQQMMATEGMRCAVGQLLAILFVVAAVFAAANGNAFASPLFHGAHALGEGQVVDVADHCQPADCRAVPHHGHGPGDTCGSVACCAACTPAGSVAATALAAPDVTDLVIAADHRVFRMRGRNIAPDTDPPRSTA